MPCILKIRVVEARDLPVMDRSTELTDAYVEVKFGDTVKKTDIQKKTLNPVFNEDFRVEVPNDTMLQDNPLEIKVWDYDVVSSNDIIGSLYIDLNCLLHRNSHIQSGPQIAGWFPIYDTIRGIRGELYVTLKLEFFGNVNEFHDSSAGIKFFSACAPYCRHEVEQVFGFVEELKVKKDPEYHWVDNFRASRISNEERQLLLRNLSGKLRRQIGRKVLELGGNAVIGYHQHFDLEGEAGIVARGYGTACRIRKISTSANTPISFLPQDMPEPQPLSQPDPPLTGPIPLGISSAGIPFQHFFGSSATSVNPIEGASSVGSLSSAPITTALERDNPIPEAAPVRKETGGSLSISPVQTSKHPYSYSPDEMEPNLSPTPQTPVVVPQELKPTVELLSIYTFHSSHLLRIGGAVMARSVKLLSKSVSEEMRNSWWFELREEIKNHAKFLGCNAVIGYLETNSIDNTEDVCVLTASGTAVVLRSRIHASHFFPSDRTSSQEGAVLVANNSENETSSIPTANTSNEPNPSTSMQGTSPVGTGGTPLVQSLSVEKEKKKRKKTLSLSMKELTPCSCFHISKKSNITNSTKLAKCNICKKKFVMENILATIPPPSGISITGQGCLLEARVCREKKKLQGENNAINVSETIPFLEYDLHRQIMYKLKVLGMNALFNVKFQITVGDSLIVAIATGTAVHVPALPTPSVIHISRTSDVIEDKQILNIQQKIVELSKQNVLLSSYSLLTTQQLQLQSATTTHVNNQSGANSSPRFLQEEPIFTTIDSVMSRSLERMPVPREQPVIDRNPTVTQTQAEANTDPNSTDDGTGVDVLFGRESDEKNTSFIVEVDDEMDEDVMVVLLEPRPPQGFLLCNTETVPGGADLEPKNVQLITAIRRLDWPTGAKRINHQLSAIFHNLYWSIMFKIRSLTRCCITCIDVGLQLLEDNEMQISLSAVVVVESSRSPVNLPSSPSGSENSSDSDHEVSASSFSKPIPTTPKKATSQLKKSNSRKGRSSTDSSPQTSPQHSPTSSDDEHELQFNMESSGPTQSKKVPWEPGSIHPRFVELTPMSFIPGTCVVRFVGRLDFHFVKETFTMDDHGGISGFTHVFLMEIHAIIRAHVAALGGNALLMYKMEQCCLMENVSKNQCYSLIGISGDIVFVTQKNDDELE